MRVGINGFGRIGRLFLRQSLEFGEYEVVAVNDLAPIETMLHLFVYDSNYGKYPGEVKSVNGGFSVRGNKINYLAEPDPSKLPWSELGVDVVLESTGRFTRGEDAAKHLEGGAKKVVISAPGKGGVDATVVYGVNHASLSGKERIISNASCTTNCLAPVAHVLHKEFGIEYGIMTTVHSYTNDQRVLDLPHKDLRRARAAGVSMIPTTTGAAKAVGLVIPELAGKLTGVAVRVPTPTVSLVDLSVVLSSQPSVEEVNEKFVQYSEGELKGVLGVTREPLVSADFKGDPRVSIVDLLSTMKVGKMYKILSWYDNEWGYVRSLVNLFNYLRKFT